MAVLRLAVLFQGLLLAARCEVRARDPEVEDLKDMSDGAGWTHEVPLVGFGTPRDGDGLNKSPDVYGAIHHPLDHKHHNPNHGHPSLDVPVAPTAETVSQGSLPRTGNWCAFVHKRAVSVAVACGTEKYIIKSQSPCPNGTPDCQINMYKISTRPVYRQKEKIYTALQWRCCPGHAGAHCEETVTGGHVSDSEDPTMASHPHPGSHDNNQGHSKPTGQIENQNREQNDFQMLGSPLYEAEQSDPENQTTADSSDDNEHNPHAGHDQNHHQDFERRDPYAVHEGIPHPETSYLHHGLLPILKEAVLSQLQPIFENFNLTLERLFHEVQGLQHDMAQLHHHQEQRRVSEPLEFGGEEHDQQETVKAELKKSLQKLEEVQAQFHNHRSEIEEKLHAKHGMLIYNLTSFKTEMDLKIKRNQKMLQVNLHSLNSSMAEIKQEQERLDEELQRVWPEKTPDPVQSQPHENTAIWEAITRLDSKVMNNTVELSALTEGQEQVFRNIEDLQSGWRDLKESIAQTGREYQIKYMETGLEVDAAKVSVLDQIKELSSNISVVQGALQDMEIDVDYLFTQYYKNTSSSAGDCKCLDLRTSVAQLDKNVAYVMEIANENRLARLSEAKMSDHRENGAWVSSVDVLKLGLLNVQKSLAFEQEKSRMLQRNMTQLQNSLMGSQQDIEELQKQNRTKVEKIQQLESTFNTLLQDAVRHSEILDVLLGEEVTEFLEWSHQDQRQYSIPALRESIKDMQEQINGHSLSLASMLNPAAPAADEPSVLEDWAKKRRGDKRFDLSEEQPEYSDNDFWTLEKTVKELGAHIRQLEDRRCLSCCNCTKSAAAAGVEVRLEEEVATLRKNLDVHLEVFNSIFRNTERFVASGASVDLEELSALLKRKEAKQHNKKQTKRPKRGIQGNIRNRRDASLESAVLRQLPDTPFMFLASTTDGANGSGTVLFERVALNHGQIYSPKTGTFHAPASGVYLFVVTLDFGPGASLAQLRRGGDVVASLRQTQRKLGASATRVCILQLEQGEQLHLELLQGNIESGNQKDNTFAGLLMLQTT